MVYSLWEKISDDMRTWFIFCVFWLTLTGRAEADEHPAQRYQDISLTHVAAVDAELRQAVLTTEQPNELLLVRGDEWVHISVPELVNIERVFRQPDGSLLVSGITASGKTGFYRFSDTGGTRNVTPENLPDGALTTVADAGRADVTAPFSLPPVNCWDSALSGRSLSTPHCAPVR